MQLVDQRQAEQFNPDINLLYTPTKPNTGLGIAAFDSVRAEEETWLEQAFELPPEFDLINGSRSALIFGAAGSGKTAVYQALVRLSLNATGKPRRLLVDWRPKPPTSTTPDSQMAERQLAQVLDACAWCILTHIVQYPADYEAARPTAQRLLLWFVRTHLQGDWDYRAEDLAIDSQAGQALFAKLTAAPVHGPLPPDATPVEILAAVVKALAEIGLEGVWVLVDRLDGWIDVAPERLSAGLTAFLSTLGLFEQRSFAYKIFLDTTMAPWLSNISGVERRRVDVHHLNWTAAKLTQVLLKRLSLALGEKVTSLDQLCTDPALGEWLERCGGLSPRGWLEYVRPLVAAYLAQVRMGVRIPISREEWLHIRRNHPPVLLVDLATRRVWVGAREIKDLPEGQYRLLAYLYQQAGKTCSRSELHYLADLGLEKAPRVPEDPHWEPPTAYSGKLDTAIWRLRESVEPDVADKPLYILTEKGAGYRLENAYRSFA